VQARLCGYGDAHRSRLGINDIDPPVNSPKGVAGGAHNYGRDGAMPVNAPNGA
jgi:catalase